MHLAPVYSSHGTLKLRTAFLQSVTNKHSSMVLETGIFISQAIWLWRVRHIRREAKKAGLTYDEYVAENPSRKFPRSDSAETVVDIEACAPTHSSEACTEKTAGQSVETLCTRVQAETPISGTDADSLQVPPNAVIKSG